MPEGRLQKIFYAAGRSGGNDIVVRDIPLKHHPHRPYVISRETPVPARLDVSKLQLLLLPPGDLRRGTRDLLCDKPLRPPGGFVIVEDPRDRENPVHLAIEPDQLVRR
jgi:hypothetical protein